MNEKLPFEDPDPSDPAVKQLRMLRLLEPSRDSKSLLRKRIAEELNLDSSSLQDTSDTPWWCRRISVPLPLALAACVIWLMPFVWLFAWQVTEDRSGRVAVNSTADSSSISNPLPSSEIRRHVRRDANPRSYNATYLCGVGQIQDTTIYSFEE